MTIVPPAAAFYERVSNDELVERNTIRNQDTSLHKTFDQHFGLEASEPWTFVGTFADDGVSGTIDLDQRPDGARLMALIRRGEVDIVCVTRGDRLTRDRAGAEVIADEFWGRDVTIRAVSEHIDLTTPAGRLQFALMCAFAHYERELIRERTMNGRARVAGEGKFINGPIPFGYDVVDGMLVPSQHEIEVLGCTEAEFVEQMYTRVKAGESARALWAWLMDSRLPSVYRYYNKKAERHRVKVYPQWKYARVRDILRSTTYYGQRVLKYSRPGAGRLKKQLEPVVQAVPPLVSRQLWNDVEQAMQGHTANFHSDDTDGFVYLLSGKLVCGYCGFKLGGNYIKRSNGRTYLYYACTLKSPSQMNARRLGTSCPDAPRLNGFVFEERVLEMIDEVVAHPEQILDALAAEQQVQRGAVDSHTQRMRTVQQRIARLQRGRAELLRSLRQGDITADEFREQSTATTMDLADAQQELAALEADSNVVRTLEEQLSEARQVIDLLAEEWPRARAECDRVTLRAMVQPLIQKIVVRRDEYEYTILFHRSSNTAQSCDCPSITRTIPLELGGGHAAA